jgi:molecular chaperone GrpE
MPKEQRIEEIDGVPPREDVDAGAVADGDAPLDDSPPNAVRTEPPAKDSDAGGSSSPSEALAAKQRELASMSDRHLRLAAEFDNYRRRSERERSELWARAQGDLASRLLDALDDLDRVADHADTTAADALVTGIQLVERKLRQALEAAGLEALEVEGERFDPNAMEAVAMMPADNPAEDDTVADVFQRGYRFKGSLLRPARVRVKKLGA